MRTSALEFLACPLCGGKLVADTEPPAADGHLLTGELASSCGARFPLRGGVPRLTPGHAGMKSDRNRRRPPSRFASEWRHPQGGGGLPAPKDEQRFLDLVAPLGPADFTNAVVLEAGCGKGRHARLAARYGARAVVAFDLSDAAVDIAFRATRHLSNVHIAQGDIRRPPAARAFDLAFSISVLHHLRRPQAGFRALYDRVVRGGRVAFWVYGYESNEWLLRWIDPVRRNLTARMPENVLYWTSLPAAVTLAATLRLYRFRALARRLPYGAYLGYISRFPLRELHHIVFDQLATEVVHYLSEEELRDWLETPDLEDAQVAWHNRNSWRALATVVGHAESGWPDDDEDGLRHTRSA
jgi:SAM-dependent methyltransferase